MKKSLGNMAPAFFFVGGGVISPSVKTVGSEKTTSLFRQKVSVFHGSRAGRNSCLLAAVPTDRWTRTPGFP